MKFFKIGLVLLVGAGVAACDDKYQTGGTVVGAGAGALVGSQFGRGGGRVAATIIGAAVGAYIGNRLGRHLDRADRAYAEQNADRAMESSETGTTSSWRNENSGNQGSVTPTSAPYRDPNRRLCRNFSETITLADGTSETVNGRRCQKPDGSWEFVG
jgi:surface antigen